MNEYFKEKELRDIKRSHAKSHVIHDVKSTIQARYVDWIPILILFIGTIAWFWLFYHYSLMYIPGKTVLASITFVVGWLTIAGIAWVVQEWGIMKVEEYEQKLIEEKEDRDVYWRRYYGWIDLELFKNKK